MKASTIAILFAAIPALAFAETPDRFVRYVESTGSQYVDTGVTGRWNTRVEMQFEWMNIDEQMMLGCGDWSDSTRFYACYCLNSDGNIATGQSSYEKVVYTNIANSTWNSWFEKNRVYDILKEAAKFYYKSFNDPDIGQPAREYASKRGLSKQTLDNFGIGYSPMSWNALYDS